MKVLEVVSAYACGICERVFIDPSDAAACCTCTGCHTKTRNLLLSGGSGKCGHCLYGERLRYARASLRQLRDDLVSAEKRLAQMLAEKKPPKGTEP